MMCQWWKLITFTSLTLQAVLPLLWLKVGIHTITYESEADSIIITHDAKNRKGFALGAVLAAEYTAEHTGFLGMNDLFNF